MPQVGGVVHTHSPYAVAWAARGEEIPCVTTGMADEFGGPIPVGPFAVIGDDSIGRGIVETLRGHRSRAVLMSNHGPFTIGVTARDAVKAAVLVEDVARTVHLARQGGPLVPIPQEAIDRLYHRYQNVYGQATDDRRDPVVDRRTAPTNERAEMPTAPLATTFDALRGLVRHRAARRCTANETLRQVAEQSQQVAAGLHGTPVRVVWKPVLTDADSIRRLALDVNARDDVVGVIAWMHTFSPAKMWIAGLDALRKPLLHLHTQANVELPWAGHRLRLHEPQPGRPR